MRPDGLKQAHYEKCMELAREIGDLRLQALVYLNRVELHKSLSDWPLAEALCHRALRIFKNLRDRLGEAEVYKFLGLSRALERDWASASAYFSKSIRLTRKLSNSLGQAEAHFEYARMLNRKGNRRTAKRHYALALALFNKVHASREISKVQQEMAALSS